MHFLVISQGPSQRVLNLLVYLARLIFKIKWVWVHKIRRDKL